VTFTAPFYIRPDPDEDNFYWIISFSKAWQGARLWRAILPEGGRSGQEFFRGTIAETGTSCPPVDWANSYGQRVQDFQ
jgi:hypothetical protein